MILIQTLHPYLPNSDTIDDSIKIEIYMSHVRGLRPFEVWVLTGRVKNVSCFDVIADAVTFAQRKARELGNRTNTCHILMHDEWNIAKVFPTEIVAHIFMVTSHIADYPEDASRPWEDLVDNLLEEGSWSLTEGEIV